jgi:hypothetical protein
MGCEVDSPVHFDCIETGVSALCAMQLMHTSRILILTCNTFRSSLIRLPLSHYGVASNRPHDLTTITRKLYRNCRNC